MPKKILINMAQSGETRVAVIENGTLEELYLERDSIASGYGNIYKGRVVNVEPSIQAAFVQIGEKRNGFLHCSDVCPAVVGARSSGDGPGGRRRIQDLLHRGQEIVCQITKNEIGEKGATLSTYISLPGRYVVLMPQVRRSGVSRKIDDAKKRKDIRSKLSSISLPPELGVIVRTAGVDRTKTELQKDLKYLLKLWDAIQAREKRSVAPVTLYQESDLVVRTIRDALTNDVDEILIDSPEGARKIYDLMRVVSPRMRGRVKLYDRREPLFYRFRLEEQIERTLQRQVPLPSGGSIVIDQTEALVAIDVNSGRFTEEKDIENTALRVNAEAAEEVARQLRLRDMGGVIVVDFIDMREEKNRREIEKNFKTFLRRDGARFRIGRISQFGIIELTRQRMGPGLQTTTHRPCPLCHGKGHVKTAESLGLMLTRMIMNATKNEGVRRVVVGTHPSTATELLNIHRQSIAELEVKHNLSVYIEGRPEFSLEQIDVNYYNGTGKTIRVR